MAKPDIKTYRDRMDRSVAALKEEFSGLRTGRANAGLLAMQILALHDAALAQRHGFQPRCTVSADRLGAAKIAFRGQRR